MKGSLIVVGFFALGCLLGWSGYLPGVVWKERKKPSASRDRMKQLLGYIEEHYGEKITIQQAASL